MSDNDGKTLATVLELPASAADSSAPQTTLGTIVGWDEETGPLVTHAGSPDTPLAAMSVLSFSRERARELVEGQQAVVLGFIDARADRPIILGLVQAPVAPAPMTAVVDDEDEVVLRGRERVELRCGKASIILTRAGKVIIRGTHVVSQSRGANRIRGGSVEIN